MTNGIDLRPCPHMRLIWWRSLNDMLKTYRSAVVLLLIEKVSVLILLSQGAGLHDMQSIRSLQVWLLFTLFSAIGKWFSTLYTCNYAPNGNFIRGEMYKRGDVKFNFSKNPTEKRESVKVWSFQPPDHTLKSKGPFLKRCNVQRC